jgi:hypothetical protein
MELRHRIPPRRGTYSGAIAVGSREKNPPRAWVFGCEPTPKLWGLAVRGALTMSPRSTIPSSCITVTRPVQPCDARPCAQAYSVCAHRSSMVFLRQERGPTRRRHGTPVCSSDCGNAYGPPAPTSRPWASLVSYTVSEDDTHCIRGQNLCAQAGGLLRAQSRGADRRSPIA